MKVSVVALLLTGFCIFPAFVSQASGSIVYVNVNQSLTSSPANGESDNTSYALTFPIYSSFPVNSTPPCLLLYNSATQSEDGGHGSGTDSFGLTASAWTELPAGVPGYPNGNFSYFPNVTPGQVIGLNSGSWGVNHGLLRFTQWGTDWGGGVYYSPPENAYGASPGIMPFRVNLFNTYYYGWVRVSIQEAYTYRGDHLWLQSSQLNVLDYAYEATPNTPIIAGMTPEPATLSLLALGGLLLVRRRA